MVLGGQAVWDSVELAPLLRLLQLEMRDKVMEEVAVEVHL
jgi:hypothetical protein